MIQHGTKPEKLDHRKYSFHRTFGNLVSPLNDVPDTFNFDAGFGMPDQEADGYPFGCTGYTQSELCQDEDLIQYSPKFTYDKTLFLEDIGPDDPNFERVGCQISDSLKSTIVYGAQDTLGSDPYSKRRGAYYDVLTGTGVDAFDSIRSAMWQKYKLTGKKGTISVGSPWLPEWNQTQNGIVPTVFIYSGNPDDYQWHNWKIAGVIQIEGVLYLMGKIWQGTRMGNNGWMYFSRETINSVFKIRGTSANMLAPYDPTYVATVKLTIYQTIVSYFAMIIKKFMSINITTPASRLDVFCAGIRDYEGLPGDLNYKNNNPGNCRCSPIGYLPKYGNVLCIETKNGKFAKFPTYELGWEYLQNLVMHRVELHSTWTFLDFFSNYAPSKDQNNPIAYAANIAKKCGVTSSTLLSQYLSQSLT